MKPSHYYKVATLREDFLLRRERETSQYVYLSLAEAKEKFEQLVAESDELTDDYIEVTQHEFGTDALADPMNRSIMRHEMRS